MTKDMLNTLINEDSLKGDVARGLNALALMFSLMGYRDDNGEVEETLSRIRKVCLLAYQEGSFAKRKEFGARDFTTAITDKEIGSVCETFENTRKGKQENE